MGPTKGCYHNIIAFFLSLSLSITLSSLSTLLNLPCVSNLRTLTHKQTNSLPHALSLSLTSHAPIIATLCTTSLLFMYNYKHAFCCFILICDILRM